MLPQPVLEAIQNAFNPMEAQVNCQLATLHETMPHVRTMMLYDVTDDGELIFVTFTNTQKWKDLESNVDCAVCFFSFDFGQIIAEGKASLATNKTSSALAATYWKKMPQDWRDNYLAGEKTSGIPDSFGVIRVVPSRWELLTIRKENYMLSRRQQFLLQNKTWLVEEMRPQ